MFSVDCFIEEDGVSKIEKRSLSGMDVHGVRVFGDHRFLLVVVGCIECYLEVLGEFDTLVSQVACDISDMHITGTSDLVSFTLADGVGKVVSVPVSSISSVYMDKDYFCIETANDNLSVVTRYLVSTSFPDLIESMYAAFRFVADGT